MNPSIGFINQSYDDLIVKCINIIYHITLKERPNIEKYIILTVCVIILIESVASSERRSRTKVYEHLIYINLVSFKIKSIYCR